jgi:hypothetical protein
MYIKKVTGKGKAHSYTHTHTYTRTQKRVIGKGNRFDVPAPQVAHTLMEMENQTRTAAIITRDQITLGPRIGEGAHGSVFEGTWANVHGSVRTYYKTIYSLVGIPLSSDVHDHDFNEILGAQSILQETLLHSTLYIPRTFNNNNIHCLCCNQRYLVIFIVHNNMLNFCTQ